MTFNQELIEKARKGEIAILNDGSVEELQLIVKEAWPTDIPASGDSKYYFADRYKSTNWRFDDQTDLPAHSVKDFFMTDTKEPEYLVDKIRTYKITRQQMKELYVECSPGLKNKIAEWAQELFGVFVDKVEVGDTFVQNLLNLFDGPTDLIRSIFPSYFFIPEGEPVLVRWETDWRIAVSDGKGGFFKDAKLSGESGSAVQIIPYTKQPPK